MFNTQNGSHFEVKCRTKLAIRAMDVVPSFLMLTELVERLHGCATIHLAGQLLDRAALYRSGERSLRRVLKPGTGWPTRAIPLMMMNSLPGKVDPILYKRKFNITMQNGSDKKSKNRLKKINQELKSSRKVALVGAPPPVIERVSRVEKAVRQRGQLKPTHLKRWAQALADPFGCSGAICPVNFNNAPSNLSTTARLTHTDLNVSVPGGQTQQWVLFPGHSGLMPDVQNAHTTPGNTNYIGSQMDPTAFHCRMNIGNIAGGGVPLGLACPGPITYRVGADTFTPVAGCKLNIALDTVNNAPAGGVGLTYDTPLPYSADIAGSGHSRFQLVSMGVRIFQTTPMIARGGNVVSVQLTNQNGLAGANGLSATTQRQLEYNPSFKTHGDCSEGIEISWIPRVQDLAYWHNLYGFNGDVTNFTQNNCAAAAMAIFFNNPTGNSLTFTVQMVFNYMLSGNFVQAISSPSTIEPSIRPQVEQTVIHLQNSASTAKTAPHVAEAANSGDDGRTIWEKLSGKAYQALAENAHRIVPVVDTVLRHYSRTAYDGPLVPRLH